jgi:S-adenosylmethionine:tRNA ribosyltransferase-isomerase
LRAHLAYILDCFNIDIENYNYSLPEERIAKYPLDIREESKLLLWKEGQAIQQSFFSGIPDHLPENALLVYNNTKVLHARLFFQKKTGATIEVFCLSPHHPVDYHQALASKKSCKWQCLIGNSKKWKTGLLEQSIDVKQTRVVLSAKRFLSNNSEQIIEFNWDSNHTFAEILESVGKIPIPPYLNRESEGIDNTRYQTVYSELPGSVAAPTAGLHFTDNIMQKIRDKNIQIAELTLHVGAGTFQPVKDKNARNHQMHSEKIFIKKQILEKLIEHEGNIIATGTTTLRTLESLYWLGVKALKKEDMSYLGQWEWEISDNKISYKDSFSALLNELNNKNTSTLSANTEIMIIPGYQFKVTNMLITNFHQPKSTLLLLIAAFTRNQWKDIYNYALENNFRFLSYGDSSLLIR